jgi:hypothetical protein
MNDQQKAKEQRLKEIEEMLKNYGGQLEIDPFVLKYLSLDELDSILLGLLKRQESIIENNHEWLQQFKKDL